MRKVYEVDGVEYECIHAWKFNSDGTFSVVPADSVSDEEMFSTIKSIREDDELQRELDELEKQMQD